MQFTVYRRIEYLRAMLIKNLFSSPRISSASLNGIQRKDECKTFFVLLLKIEYSHCAGVFFVF